MCDCEGREHGSSACWACRRDMMRATVITTSGTQPTFVPGGVGTASRTVPLVDVRSSGGRLQPMRDPYKPRPDMPMVWGDDGDDG